VCERLSEFYWRPPPRFELGLLAPLTKSLLGKAFSGQYASRLHGEFRTLLLYVTAAKASSTLLLFSSTFMLWSSSKVLSFLV